MTRRTIELIERRTRTVRLPRSEVDFLLGHARGVIEVTPTFERRVYRLTARGHVGVIDGPKGRYAIGPKIPWPNVCMLLGARPKGTAGERAEPEGGLLGALANEFADRLDAVVRSGLVAGHGEEEGTSRFLRGRLRAAEQMRDAAARAFPDRFHVDQPVFDLHTAWNRVPKATASALLRRGGLPESIRKRVQDAAVPLLLVPDVPATETDFADAYAEPRAVAYRPLLDICRVILDGLKAANPLGTDAGAFLVDLGKAFEDYVAAGLKRAVAEPTLPKRQALEVEAHPAFPLGPTELRPDVLIRKEGRPHAVLDAKWKAADPEAADLHQVLAYATLTGVDHVGLVYPGLTDARGQLTTPDGRVRVSVLRLRVVGSAGKLTRSLAWLANML